jgi:hypothetical protein
MLPIGARDYAGWIDLSGGSTMDQPQRLALIARYREGPAFLAAIVDGQPDAALDRRPADRSWSAREIVHHVADSEMTSAIRLRRLLAEDTPTIIGYDEEHYARVLYYDRPIAKSLAAIRAARESTAEILERLTDEQWCRGGRHNESGAYGVETWLQIYAAHCHDHAEQARRAISGG